MDDRNEQLNALQSVGMMCPANMLATGGGYQLQGRVGDISVLETHPAGGSYKVVAINTSTYTADQVRVTATCVG